MTFTVRPFQRTDAAACAAILESLPEWFGLPEVNAGYVDALTTETAFVVFEGNQDVVAFLGLHRHNERSWEIEVMGIRRELHGMGIGRRLVAAAVEQVMDAGARWLHVKTRGPATYDDDYEKTRRFYLAVGFEPLYESLTEWGADDAALVLVMAITSA